MISDVSVLSGRVRQCSFPYFSPSMILSKPPESTSICFAQNYALCCFLEDLEVEGVIQNQARKNFK